jgi:peptidoglycan/xylan/chitin deacetylase (PgdA/CDA1 family)
MFRVPWQCVTGRRLARAACWLALLACGVLAAPARAQQAPLDVCPHGWSSEQTVAFSPHGPDSGVLNPVDDFGCTLLDVVWNAEPFRAHGDFVWTVRRAARNFQRAGLLTSRGAGRIIAVAARTEVGGRRDLSIDNSCPNRIAVTFDDGPSFYRPQTLAILRERQVPATFFDVGIRVDANPQLARFEATEGHLVLNHTYSHPNLAQITVDSIRRQILETEAALARAGAPLPFKALRPPHRSSNASVEATAAELGYTLNGAAGSSTPVLETWDFLPTTSALQIRDAIVNSLQPGAMILLHDGPIDTPAGAAVIEALPQIINAARQREFCFGLVDSQSRVVAARHVSTQRRIPSIINSVPYLPLPAADGLTPPSPYAIVNHPF